MLLVRKEQLDHFRAKGTTRYVERLAAYLEEEFADVCAARGLAAPDAIHAFAREATALAHSWGFDIELDTTQLALILLWYGLDARKKSELVDGVLRDKQLYPIGRVRKILATARRDDPAIARIDITLPGAELLAGLAPPESP